MGDRQDRAWGPVRPSTRLRRAVLGEYVESVFEVKTHLSSDSSESSNAEGI